MTISLFFTRIKNMNTQIVSVVITEGSKFLAEIIRLNLPRRLPNNSSDKPVEAKLLITPPAEPRETASAPDIKIKKGTACLPCTNSHLHTCSGLLNEAVRMSPDGLNVDSMERVDKCLGEIAAAERVDLSPENITNLSPNEKTIASTAAKEIRDIRHGLEGLKSKEELNDLAVRTTNLQKYVGKEWFKLRLAKMPQGEKAKIVDNAIERLSGG